MFSKKTRLLKGEIEEILLKGLRIHSPNLVFVFKKNKTHKIDRFTVVVLKKVSPQATERNKIKRRIRAVLKTTQKTQKNGARDGVLITKPKSSKLSFKALKQEIEDLLKK
jgi:ribonuclease P protein component